MKFHIFAFFLVFILLLSSVFTASAQVDSVIGQVTSSINESVAGGITGDGRFVVFESSGDVATYRVDNQPNNADGNRELFIFDYAQRRIFQITNTKALLKDATKAPTFDNVRVNIANIRPVISSQPDAEGNYWIAFSSNATCSYPGNPNGGITSVTNPGNFDANAPSEPGATPDDPPVNKCSVTSGSSTINNLVNDGNTELWLYKVPAVPPVADLSVGEEVPLTVLSGGTFTRLTNTRPSRLPVAGTTTSQPIIADDNHDSSIDSTGAAVSFTSNRDLLPCPTAPSATCGNAATLYDNDEIFSYVRSNNALKQITATPRGTVGNPIYNTNSTITDLSGGGWRIAFMSNADKPVTGMTGSNADNNEEIFYVDLTAQGGLGDALKQVTTTARTNPGDVVNILNYGRRMSRDGRYIAFDSTADLAPPTGQQPGANKPGFGTFVYDTQTSTFRIFLARSDADSGAFGGDVQRYPSFTTAFDSRGIAQPTLVLETRMNIKSDGTVATVADEGLNNISDRPAQIYSFLLNVSAAADPAKFIRITKLPRPLFFLASVQPLTTNFLERMAFNLSQTEFGTGNSDLNSEVFYSVLPEVVSQSPASLNFATGASRIPVTASPVPTPSPTATPTATPTPSPSATPTPSPTPQQPSAVQGVAPGMLAILDYDSGLTHPIAAQTAVGSLDRRFTLPIELSGVTLTVNGAAAGLKMVSRRQIVFVVPPGLGAADAGTVYPVVVQNNGVVFRGSVTVVPARPDIFTNLLTPGPGGRAKVFNATNRVLTTEPFAVRTFRLRGSRLVPSVLRVYLTGVDSGRFITSPSQITVRIGNTQITPVTTLPVLFEPGVFTFDFTLPASIAGAGDQPIVVSVTIGGITYTSRLDDTAPRLFIL